MKTRCSLLPIFILFGVFVNTLTAQPNPGHNLVFDSVPHVWDEGIPLGNGLLGALVWQKDSFLRISLDRADLWDLRPVKEFSLPQFRFSWVRGQWLNGTYDTVQKLFDLPYERDPGPTKIPAGAIMIPISGLGAVEKVRLTLADACCRIDWVSGITMKIFVDAARHQGCFQIQRAQDRFQPELHPPDYFQPDKDAGQNSVDGQSLSRLGYPAPTKVIRENGLCYFRQPISDNQYYSIQLCWRDCPENCIEGYWEIIKSSDSLTDSLHEAGFGINPNFNFETSYRLHAAWWNDFWTKSSVSIPDPLLEKQYYLELYKFGSASRKGAPPITLQAVWTADNGKLPPWKGDYHNDLNTQMSYWPGYVSNHLDESQVFTDWLWKNKENAVRYTTLYFQCQGLNYPGVSTLSGEPMGGWIQYALSPTISAWLAQHFYLQWKYSMNEGFLREQAYPFVKEVVSFLENLSVKNGKDRSLPLSSSPEINDNSAEAWFPDLTNYDISLIHAVYKAAIEMAIELGNHREAAMYSRNLGTWPNFMKDHAGGLMIAPEVPVKFSHRHFSHLMAIFPLGLYNWHGGKGEQQTIRTSLDALKEAGSDYWCGYSYAWQGILEARAGNGSGAVDALSTFARCFCLPNSFHVNGDQSGNGKSKFTYRPFTLEGNFAFATGIQEMLLQSNDDVVRVFPAIPGYWKDVSFQSLRAMGAFLVSAEISDGLIRKVQILSENGGRLELENPFRSDKLAITGLKRIRVKNNGNLLMETKKGQKITLMPAL